MSKAKAAQGVLQALFDLNPGVLKEWMTDPRKFSAKQHQDLYEIKYQDEPFAQDIMSIPQLREEIEGIEKWIESKKDQPAFEGVVYLFSKKVQELKEQLKLDTEIKDVGKTDEFGQWQPPDD